ncbi:MAG: hypothetical protein UMV23_06175 [Halanaerobium sp.]|nr:hypothetical protein [Halanaerobium sp.]
MNGLVIMEKRLQVARRWKISSSNNISQDREKITLVFSANIGYNKAKQDMVVMKESSNQGLGPQRAGLVGTGGLSLVKAFWNLLIK